MIRHLFVTTPSYSDEILQEKLKLLVLREKQLQDLGLTHERTMIWLQVLQQMAEASIAAPESSEILEKWTDNLVSELRFPIVGIFEVKENNLLPSRLVSAGPSDFSKGIRIEALLLEQIKKERIFLAQDFHETGRTSFQTLLGLGRFLACFINPYEGCSRLMVAGHLHNAATSSLDFNSEDACYFQMSTKSVEDAMRLSYLLKELSIERSKLKKVNENLESLVLEQTKELRATNHQLQENILKLKTAQQQLMEASKLSALGQMAGGVAHEINTPLGIIQGNAGLLQDLMLQENFDKIKASKMVGRIITTTDRIAKIIVGLMTFSREGEADLFSTENLEDIAKDTIALCSEKFKFHGIEFKIKFLEENVMIKCKAVQISQVLLSLLNNAFDAVKNEPSKWITVNFKKGEDSVEIEILDSGVGIRPEVQSKIFQPFFTTKEVGQGPGLGLSVSLGIIQHHGGDLSFDPTAQNTRFVIHLPLQKISEKYHIAVA